MSNILVELDKWEEIIFENEEMFCRRFCKSDDFWILNKVSWNAHKMYISYILHSGQHIGDGFPIKDWLDFLVKIGDNTQYESKTTES